MSDYTKYTKQEMQAYAIAKNIKENQIVIVGTGLPLIGASLAKRAVCPSCHPIVESGLMDCDPVEVPRSVGDNRFMASASSASRPTSGCTTRIVSSPSSAARRSTRTAT
jgi:glutaconate CoA-transferase subunit B